MSLGNHKTYLGYEISKILEKYNIEIFFWLKFVNFGKIIQWANFNFVQSLILLKLMLSWRFLLCFLLKSMGEFSIIKPR